MAVNNTITALIPTLFAQGLLALRSNLVMPSLVLNHYGTEARRKGENILIPLPSNMATNAVTPAAYAPDPQNIAPVDASIPLSNWQEAAFTLGEQEVAQIIDGVVPMQLSAAMQALAFAVNASIFSNYVYVPNVVSDAQSSGMVTPFASSPAVATQAGTMLTQALAPMQDRKIVLAPGSWGQAVVLPQFAYALYAGDKDAVDSGIISRKFGFDWAQDQQVPFQTAGSITTGCTVNTAIPAIAGGSAGGAAGGVNGQVVVISLKTAASTGAASFNAGDVLQFGTAVGGSAAYGTGLLTATVTQATAQAVANTAFNVPVVLNANAEKLGVAATTAVNVVPSHMVNMAFHRQAFAFASRPLEGDRLGITDPDLVHQVSDPVSGISLRLILRPEYHRTRAAFDILWGTAPVRPNLACRIMGGVNG